MSFLVNVCDTNGLLPVIRILKAVYTLLKWAIPIVLILFGTIDLAKAVIASKEDEMKKAQGTLIKRVVYAVVIFFLFTIVNLVINLVADANAGTENSNESSIVDTSDWTQCWKIA